MTPGADNFESGALTGADRPYAHSAALYWAAGWQGVLPLPERAKTPPPSGWTGHAGGWPARADLQGWIEDRGSGNVALRLPQGVIGLDVDAYGGKQGKATYDDAVTRWGKLPLTWRSTNREPGQGSISLYRAPAGLAWPGELGPGVEIIQTGHRYMVVWPSIHPEGRPYRWVHPNGDILAGPPQPDDLPELPEPWVRGITGMQQLGEHPHAGFVAAEVTDWLVKHGTGQPCATMTRTLAAYADKFGRGASRHEAGRNAVRRITGFAAAGHPGMTAALAQVEGWFAESVKGDKKRTPDRHEWRRMVNGAVQLAAVGPVPAHDPCLVPTIMPVPAQPLLAREPAQTTESVDPLHGLRNAKWLGHQEFPDLVVFVHALLVEGLTLLVGAPKVGKSWLTLATALAVSTGGTVLDLPVAHRDVLYLALEDGPRRLQWRMRKLWGDRELPERLDYMTALPGSCTVAEVAEAWLDRHDGGLVLVDTLGVARGPQLPGESLYNYDYRVGRELKKIADSRPGTALTVVHHDRKADSPDFVHSISGSNGLGGSTDSVLIVRRERAGTDGLIQVTGREVVEAEYAASFVDCTWSLQGGSLTEASKRAAAVASGLGRGAVTKAIVGYITDQSSGTPKQVADALELDHDLVRQTMSRLHRDGRLDKIERGVYVLPAA